VLEVAGVSKRFGDREVLESVSLEARDGEFVSILGPSGCGKTSLLRMIAGLDWPDSGAIRLGGQDLLKLDPHRRNVHTVFQRYALFPHMNVFENVAFGLRCHRTPEPEVRKRVEEMLEIVELRGHGHRRVQTLSGGEQQRVALVRALVNLPHLLLLDEPLGALDRRLRLQLQQELITIQRRVKTTFLFVTHDQEEALVLSDRVAVMNRGRVEQFGTPQEIYEVPQTRFVASFVGQLNQIEGSLRVQEGAKPVLEVESLGAFTVDSNGGGAPAPGRGVVTFRPEKATLYARRPPTAENSLEGYLEGQAYLGTHTQFDVKLANGAKIMVFQQNAQRAVRRAFQAGDRVVVAWRTADARFFPDVQPDGRPAGRPETRPEARLP